MLGVIVDWTSGIFGQCDHNLSFPGYLITIHQDISSLWKSALTNIFAVLEIVGGTAVNSSVSFSSNKKGFNLIEIVEGIPSGFT